MKKTILWTVVCLGTLMGTASAQMVNTIKITLPFDASVGGVTLPAGDYTISDLQDDGASSVLRIFGPDGKSVLALAMEVVAPKNRPVSDEAKVVLKQTEAGYQIETIWLAGREIGYEFFK
ncbi:MAG: hypothetical protein ABSF22_06130 [Bryobacteraceae bacterium]